MLLTIVASSSRSRRNAIDVGRTLWLVTRDQNLQADEMLGNCVLRLLS